MANPVTILRCFSWRRHGEPPHLRSNAGGHGGGFQPDGCGSEEMENSHLLSLSLVVVDDDYELFLYHADDFPDDDVTVDDDDDLSL